MDPWLGPEWSPERERKVDWLWRLWVDGAESCARDSSPRSGPRSRDQPWCGEAASKPLTRSLYTPAGSAPTRGSHQTLSSQCAVCVAGSAKVLTTKRVPFTVKKPHLPAAFGGSHKHLTDAADATDAANPTDTPKDEHGMAARPHPRAETACPAHSLARSAKRA